MPVYSKEYVFATKGEIDVLDVTDYVGLTIDESGILAGTATVFTSEESCGIVVMEYEHGLIQDLKKVVGRIVPRGDGYVHDTIDDDAHSHLRAALIGPSVSIPFSNGNLQLGAWQQVLFVDFGRKPTTRRLMVQVVGE